MNDMMASIDLREWLDLKSEVERLTAERDDWKTRALIDEKTLEIREVERDRLTAELAQWTTWGTIEVAAHIGMDHWESRATKAEVERDRLREEVEFRSEWVSPHVYDSMRAHADRLRAALELAVALLKQTFADESVWDMYWAKSKEAAPLREALAGAKEEGK